MARTPSYVRLADRLALGMLVDVESGWGVSGFDVRHMPDEDSQPLAFEWAKRQLALGNLEEAGKAEWDEVHEVDVEEDEETPVVRFVDVSRGLPENKLREKVRTHGEKLASRRQLREDERLDAELDRLEADASDDDNDFVDTSLGGGRAGDAQGPTALERRAAKRAAGEAPKKSKKSKSKRAASDDDEDAGS